MTMQSPGPTGLRLKSAAPDARLSLLIELEDRPGALEAILRCFSAHGVNLTHIESRPARGATFDFFVDCEGERGQAPIEAVIGDLEGITVNLLTLDRKQVPWFPRQLQNLDVIANRTLEAGTDLKADHPGFNDPAYRARRAMIDELARNYRQGQPIPLVDYTAVETATWREVYTQLAALHEQYACAEYRRTLADLEQHCGFGSDRVPQARVVSAFLEGRTGFRLRPVAGLLHSRDFLNGLAFRVFFSTQYIRHHSKPLYTPEPDICHELIGHAPMFADAAFADLSQEIGLASLGASDAEIEHLARCYWYSVEFGLLQEGGALKAYGAGLLSSFGELEYACTPEGSNGRRAAMEPWQPAVAAERAFPITEYQPLYFVAPSLYEAKARTREYCKALPRPFYARYNPTTQSIWVDRAVQRQQ